MRRCQTDEPVAGDHRAHPPSTPTTSRARARSPAPTMPLCVLPSDGPRGRLVRPARVPAQAARRPPGGRGDDDETDVDDICGEPRKYPHGSVLSRRADGEPPAADRPLLDGRGSWMCRRSVCPLRTVPLLAQRTVLALGLLGARGLVDGQARCLPAVVPGLEPPSAQRRLGHAQLTRELGDRRAARAQPAHRLGPELRRVRRTRSWHRVVPSGRPRPRCPGLRVGLSLTPSIGQRQLATRGLSAAAAAPTGFMEGDSDRERAPAGAKGRSWSAGRRPTR